MPSPWPYCTTITQDVWQTWPGTYPGVFYGPEQPIPAGSFEYTLRAELGLSDPGTLELVFAIKNSFGVTLLGGTGGLGIVSPATSAADPTRIAFPIGSSTIQFGITETAPPSTGGTIGGQLSFDIYGDCIVCANGAQPKPGVNNALIVTGGLVSAVLLVADAPYLAIAFDTFIGLSMQPGNLCGSNPPPMPFIDVDTMLGFSTGDVEAIAKLWQVFQVLAWPVLCECTPATPTPNPPPPPPPMPEPPPGGHSPPPITPPVLCDNTSLCGAIDQLRSMVQAIQVQLQGVSSGVTLIQRQAVPFGFIPGTTRAGLTGSGNFAVQGILGLRVSLTTVPTSWGMSSDNPRRYIPAPGSVTLSTASGAQLTAWINDAEQVFFDEFNGTATRVYYHFKPGVTGSIQLLNREP